MTAWLHVIGLTENGLESLPQKDLSQVASADLVISPDRFLNDIKAIDGFSGQAITWPQPFLDIIPLLEVWRRKNGRLKNGHHKKGQGQKGQGQKVVICATGDPLWFGAASTLTRYFGMDEMTITPAASGFQWAAARMGWPLHSARCLTVHGRPHETVLKHLAPAARLLVIAHDHQTPDKLAAMLDAAGYGDADLTVMGHIGGAHETCHQAKAKDWLSKRHDIADFHILAITCPAYVEGFLPLTPGLPDHAFESDGKLTKAEVRAASLAALKPCDGGILWDLGCGSGAVGIEWMRAAPHARAFGLDNRQDRLDVAAGNAARLGVPEWQGICADLPDGLDDLPQPDAVFIGGGLTAELVAYVLTRLKSGGRLVVNTVTLESEAVLLALWQEWGGDLKRIQVSRADPVGPFHGWRPLMPVTQWFFEAGSKAGG